MLDVAGAGRLGVGEPRRPLDVVTGAVETVEKRIDARVPPDAFIVSQPATEAEEAEMPAVGGIGIMSEEAGERGADLAEPAVCQGVVDLDGGRVAAPRACSTARKT